jgi:hypothetical protein
VPQRPKTCRGPGLDAGAFNTAVKTRGSSVVSVSLIRSQVNNCTIVVDHGFGTVRLDGNHIVKCSS